MRKNHSGEGIQIRGSWVRGVRATSALWRSTKLLKKKSGLLELDEAEHGVDPALVVVELEDAAGDDGVDVGAEN